MLRIRSGTRVRLTDNGNGNGNAAVAAAVAVGDAPAPGAESRELASPPASEPGAPWLAGSSHPAGGEPQSDRRRRRRRAHTATQSGASPWDTVKRELDRCRRYERTFALVALPAATAAAEDAVIAHVRSVDLVWNDGDAVCVLMAEATALDAANLVARLREDAPELAANARLAAFPTSGMTLRGLRVALYAGSVGPSRVMTPALEPARSLEPDLANAAARNGASATGTGDLASAGANP